MLDISQQRGERIDQTLRTRYNRRRWGVRSRSAYDKCRLTLQRKKDRRTCADFHFRGQKCEGISAVEAMVVCFLTLRFFGLSSSSLSGLLR